MDHRALRGGVRTRGGFERPQAHEAQRPPPAQGMPYLFHGFPLSRSRPDVEQPSRAPRTFYATDMYVVQFRLIEFPLLDPIGPHWVTVIVRERPLSKVAGAGNVAGAGFGQLTLDAPRTLRPPVLRNSGPDGRRQQQRCDGFRAAQLQIRAHLRCNTTGWKGFLCVPLGAQTSCSPRRHEESQRISSRLRVFVVRFFGLRLGCSVFICGFLYAFGCGSAASWNSRRGFSVGAIFLMKASNSPCVIEYFACSLRGVVPSIKCSG